MYKLLLIFLTSLQLFAFDNIRTSLNFSTENNGSISPELDVSYIWNEQFFSSLLYKNSNSLSSGKVDGFANSKLATVSQQETIRLNVLNYQFPFKKFQLSAGFSFQNIKFNTNEYGYINDTTAELSSNPWIVLDNQIEINYFQSMLNFELNYQLKSLLDIRFSGFISNGAKLNVVQTTEFRPLVTTTGTNNSQSTQNFSFELAVDAYLKTALIFDISLRAYMQHLPLNYSIAEIASDGVGGYLFQKTIVNSSEDSYYGDIKINFKKKILTLLPFIGWRLTVEDTTNLDTNTRARVKTQKIIFGFENRF